MRFLPLGELLPHRALRSRKKSSRSSPSTAAHAASGDQRLRFGGAYMAGVGDAAGAHGCGDAAAPGTVLFSMIWEGRPLRRADLHVDAEATRLLEIGGICVCFAPWSRRLESEGEASPLSLINLPAALSVQPPL